MIKNEFNRWFEYHLRLFPTVSSWFDGLDAETRKVQKDAWFFTVQQFYEDECKAASNSMKRGDFEAPNANQDHAKAIRGEANVIRLDKSKDVETKRRVYKKIDGYWVYDCKDCSDTGFVSIVRPKCYQEARDHGIDCQISFCAVPCKCNRANEISTRTNKEGQPIYRYRFDDTKMFAESRFSEDVKTGHIDWKRPMRAILDDILGSESKIDSGIQLFLDWLKEFDSRKVEAMPNYEPAFRNI